MQCLQATARLGQLDRVFIAALDGEIDDVVPPGIGCRDRTALVAGAERGGPCGDRLPG